MTHRRHRPAGGRRAELAPGPAARPAARRPATRPRRSYDALFAPVSEDEVTARRARRGRGLRRRAARATTRPRAFYAERLAQLAPHLAEPVAQAEIAAGRTTGPYGGLPRRGAGRRERRRAALPARRRRATCSASGSPPRSSTRTCSCSARARRTAALTALARRGLDDRRDRDPLAARRLPRFQLRRRRRPPGARADGSHDRGRSHPAMHAAFTQAPARLAAVAEPLAERRAHRATLRGARRPAARASPTTSGCSCATPRSCARARSSTRTSSTTPPRGCPRAERELAAAATSRVNGCVFCASVHARFAAHYSQARRTTCSACSTRASTRRSRRALERDHRRRGRPHRDARSRSAPTHVDAPARGRARRPGDRRRHPRRRVLQLGEPAHALARRARHGGSPMTVHREPDMEETR